MSPRLRVTDPLRFVLAPCLLAGAVAVAALPSGSIGARQTAAQTRTQAMRLTARLVGAPVRWHAARWWPAFLPSSMPTARPSRRSIAAVAKQYGVSAATLRRVMRFRSLATAAWKGHGALLLAVAAVESAGRIHAIDHDPNGSTDYGVVQLNTCTMPAYGMTPAAAMRPGPSLRVAATILRLGLRDFGSVPYALEMFHGGPGAVGVDWQYAAAVERWIPAIRAAEGGAAA